MVTTLEWQKQAARNVLGFLPERDEGESEAGYVLRLIALRERRQIDGTENTDDEEE